jgi:hypothetical protein
MTTQNQASIDNAQTSISLIDALVSARKDAANISDYFEDSCQECQLISPFPHDTHHSAKVAESLKYPLYLDIKPCDIYLISKIEESKLCALSALKNDVVAAAKYEPFNQKHQKLVNSAIATIESQDSSYASLQLLEKISIKKIQPLINEIYKNQKRIYAQMRIIASPILVSQAYDELVIYIRPDIATY